ncbi:hypothetical protein BD560DRAFT_381618 [Blakeslea trispora]|nr:hypothetical protein BD560DRAFT_381618 [Blakeslea trispora]
MCSLHFYFLVLFFAKSLTLILYLKEFGSFLCLSLLWLSMSLLLFILCISESVCIKEKE